MVRLPLRGLPARPATARAPTAWLALASVAIACLALAGCTPEPPEKERKPEPQAAQANGPGEEIQAPIDRARAVDGQLEQAEQRQRDAIEDAGG